MNEFLRPYIIGIPTVAAPEKNLVRLRPSGALKLSSGFEYAQHGLQIGICVLQVSCA